MTGSLGDMGNLLRQAQEMQRELDRVREELKTRTVEGTAGGGVVRIEMSVDRQDVQKVEIAPDVLKSGDKDLIEDLVLTALRDALKKAGLLANEAMSKVTGGLNLPGLF
ncbi:MAG: YbaB/EbfC family nucleoid-associated protein [Planctomycetota bacterium]|nr:YbaB/EbfC family nucleoid-associated protein [Planctomycetota bacterium]